MCHFYRIMPAFLNEHLRRDIGPLQALYRRGRKIIFLLLFELWVKRQRSQLIYVIILYIELLLVYLIILPLLRSQNNLVVFVLILFEVLNFLPHNFLKSLILVRV